MKVLIIVLGLLSVATHAYSKEEVLSQQYIDAQEDADSMNEVLDELNVVPEVDPQTGEVDGYSIINISDDGYFSMLGYKFGDEVAYYDEFELDGPKDHRSLLQEAIRKGLYNGKKTRKKRRKKRKIASHVAKKTKPVVDKKKSTSKKAVPAPVQKQVKSK